MRVIVDIPELSEAVVEAYLDHPSNQVSTWDTIEQRQVTIRRWPDATALFKHHMREIAKAIAATVPSPQVRAIDDQIRALQLQKITAIDVPVTIENGAAQE